MKNILFIKNILLVNLFLCLAYSQTMPTDAPAAPTADAGDVASLFSDTYTDVAATWNPDWGQTTVVEDVTIAENIVKKYSNFTFSGIEPGATINGSTHTHFMMNYWTSDATDLKVKLVDYGTDDAWGTDNVEVELSHTITTGSWGTISLPIADFIAAGLTTSSNIGQIVLSAVGATNPVYLDNIYVVNEEAITPLVINDFNTLVSATDEGDGAFWVEADETESTQNYSTLIQIPTDQAPDSDSPVMSWTWGTDGDLGWGGYTSVYHVYDAAVDLSEHNYLSFKFYNLTPPANLGSMAFRVNLFDVSDATTWDTRDDVEVWFSFFEGEANSPFYTVADDGWVEYRIPLVGGTTTGPYNNGFVLTYASWTVGIPGNGVLNLDQIGGLSIEVVQTGTGTNYGEFMLEDIQAIYSADVPGCMDQGSCNYNPDATIDDGSCYSCVDVTFNLDMSSISTYTESDTPYLAGGSFFGAPGNPDFALSYNSDLGADSALVFSKTVQLRENTTFGYTYSKDGNTSWSGKENISGQDCAVGEWSDREMTTSANDTTINACYGTCTDNEFCPAFNLIDVTFVVNMQNEQVDDTGVFLHGGWFGWGTMAMSDDNSDGVYELTIPDMTEGSVIEFKFQNGTVVETVPTDCENINTFGNRTYTLPAADTTIGPICFGGCVDCAPVVPVDVTFNLDMSGVDGFDGSDAPYVFGSFNEWNNFGGELVLTDENSDMVYTGTVNNLMSDQQHFVLFGYGTTVETVPGDCSVLDQTLNLNVRPVPLVDAAGDTTLILDAVAFGLCPVDNTMPTDAPAAPTADAGDVASLFSDTYTDVAATWNPDWGQTTVVEDVTIAENIVKKYSNFTFSGIEPGATINGSTHTHFMMNYWTSDATDLKVKLVDYGTDDAWGTDNVEVELSHTLTTGSWGTISLPIADFIAAGLTTSSNIGQIVLSAVGATNPVYLDNIYMMTGQLSSKNDTEIIPLTFSSRAYPNPFNPYINIAYELPNTGRVQVDIVNLLGQSVKTLVNAVQSPGSYVYRWDGKDINGVDLNSGIYLAIINHESKNTILKITYLK